MISREEIGELPDVATAREPTVMREGRFYVVKNKGMFEVFDPGDYDKKMDHYNPLVFRLYKSVGRCLSPEATLALLRLMS